MEIALGLAAGHVRASETTRPRFGFVRHPIDRLASAFDYGRQSGKIAAQDLPAFLSSGHFLALPQVHWLDAEMDFIGRFERVDEDWARIDGARLPKHNTSQRVTKMTDRMIDLAARHYAADFAAFGYTVN